MVNKKIIEEIPLGALLELCDAYDVENGAFPESLYQGAALYEFYCRVIGRKEF